MLVFLRTMGNMKEDCMHIAQLFFTPKLISIILMKKNSIKKEVHYIMYISY
jgi:hypothetical protein